MQNSKLISICNTLTSEEWSSFRKYLLIKTRRDSDNFQFFEFLQKRKDRLELLDDSEILRKKYFPKFSQKSFLNLMSRLTLWLEEWMAIHIMEQKSYDADLYRIEFLNRKGLYRLANQQFKALEKSLDKNKTQDLYTNEIKWKLLHYQYYSDNPFKKDSARDFFRELIEFFQKWIKDKSSLYLVETINREAVRRIDYEDIQNSLMETILLLPSSELQPILEALIKLVAELDLDSSHLIFNKLKAGDIKKESQLHSLLSMYLVTYSLKMWGEGHLKDAQFLLDIYEYALEQRVLMQSGRIPVVRFHNIISTIGAVQEYKKTEEFIDRWYKSVDSDHPESTRALALAQNAFYHDNYSLILEEIRNIEFENTVQKARALGLEVIAIYKDENLKHEILHGKIKNFERFLKRNKNKLSTHYQLSHLNLMQLIMKLYKRELNKSISIDLNKYSPLIYRTWISKELKKTRSIN